MRPQWVAHQSLTTDPVAKVDTKKKLVETTKQLIVIISSYNGSNSMDVWGSVAVGVEGAMASNLKTGS